MHSDPPDSPVMGIGYEKVPPIVLFSGSCRNGPQEVRFQPLERSRRGRLLSRLLVTLRRLIGFPATG